MATKRSIKEVVLPRGSYCYLLDRTSGDVTVLTGPLMHRNAEESESPVVWDEARGRVVECSLDRALSSTVTVPAGSYAVVTNPALRDDKLYWPNAAKTPTGNVALSYGRRVNVPWPGQNVEIRQGHQLEADQYLVCRVYDDAFSAGFDNVMPIGARFIVRGIERSFFMPPNGVEVMRQADVARGQDPYVRRARQLGPQEFCLLRATDGSRRYVYGYETSLVIPEADEDFDNDVSFRHAIDLSLNGVQIMVVRGYTTGDGDDAKMHKVGERLFITATSGVYWPRIEHHIVAVVPAMTVEHGNAVFIRGLESQEIRRVEGPTRVLPNPWVEEVTAHPAGPSFLDIDAGYAVRILDRDTRATHVELGPQRYQLDFNEAPIGQRLRIKNNEYDITIAAVTADAVPCKFAISLLYDFLGDAELWHDIQPNAMINDWAIGRIQRLIKATKIDDVFDHLNEMVTTELMSDGGTTVGNLSIEDANLVGELMAARRDSTMHALELARQNRMMALANAKRIVDQNEAEKEQAKIKIAAEIAKLRASVADEQKRVELERALEREQNANEVTRVKLEREAAEAQQRQRLAAEQQALNLQQLDAETNARVALLSAVSPQLTAALETQGRAKALDSVVKHLGPAAMARDVPVMELTNKLLTGTMFEGLLEPAAIPTRGTVTPTAEA
jgi:hypothetical protein